MQLSPLASRLRLTTPCILSPLAGGPSTPELAAAVANAGGLGFLGLAYLNPAQMAEAIAQTKQLTQRPFGVNLFAPTPTPAISAAQLQGAIAATQPYRDELQLPAPTLAPPYAEDFAAQFAIVLATKPAVFSFVFGLLDRAAVQACREAGVTVFGTATTVTEGLALQDLGVDAVVAQGAEAGGHRGAFSIAADDRSIGLLPLVRGLVGSLRIPVIAAGGLMDGAGIAAVLALGAQAAQLGTAFLLCPEAGTSAPYRAALRDPERYPSTQLTRAFSGRWARGLDHRLMREMALRSEAILPWPSQNMFTQDIRRAAAKLGRSEFLSLWAGQGVQQIRELPAGDLVHALTKECAAALARLSD